MTSKAHNERCRSCKQRIAELLSAIFGEVKPNHDLDLPSHVDDYKASRIGPILATKHDALQKHRGHRQFVRARKLPRVDFFVPTGNLIVEFDESQHFTRPRQIALDLYPQDIQLGFSITRWKTLCGQLCQKDNDPPFRDEQRAWYDTVRDLVPMHLETGKAVRLYSRDMTWCNLDASKEHQVELFRAFLAGEGAQ